MPLYRKYCSRTRSYNIFPWSTRTYSASERTHEECSETTYDIVRFTSVRIRTNVVSHGVRDRTERRSTCRYEFVSHELQYANANRNDLYIELQCEIATATQYRFARTHYVHNIGSIIRREVSRGQILPRGFHFVSRVVLYIPKVPRVGRLLTHHYVLHRPNTGSRRARNLYSVILMYLQFVEGIFVPA